MKNEAYRQTVLRHGPSRQQKAEIWARLEAASRAEMRPHPQPTAQLTKEAKTMTNGTMAHPMTPQQRYPAYPMNQTAASPPRPAGPRRAEGKPSLDQRLQRKSDKGRVLPRLAALAAALVLVLCAGLLFPLLQKQGQSMNPLPRTGSEMPAAKGKAEDPSSTHGAAALPRLLIPHGCADQSQYAAYADDPFRLPNPLQNGLVPPEKMPVYQLSDLKEKKEVESILYVSLERAAKVLQIPFSMETLEITQKEGKTPLLTVLSEDQRFALTASLSLNRQVYLNLFGFARNQLKAEWPTGFVFMNREEMSDDLVSVYDDSPEALARVQALNADNENRPKALTAFIASREAMAQQAIFTWQEALPWSGDEALIGLETRGLIGMGNDFFSYRTLQSAPLAAEEGAFPGLQGEVSDGYAQQLYNSGLRSLQWQTAADLTSVDPTMPKLYLQSGDITLSDALSHFLSVDHRFPEASDPLKHSRSPVIGYRFWDAYPTARYLGDYPLRSVDEGEAFARSLIGISFDGKLELLGAGMSYLPSEYHEGEDFYLMPYYDFLFQGKLLEERPMASSAAAEETSIASTSAAETEEAMASAAMTSIAPTIPGRKVETNLGTEAPYYRVHIRVPAIQESYLLYQGGIRGGEVREILNERGELVATEALNAPTETAGVTEERPRIPGEASWCYLDPQEIGASHLAEEDQHYEDERGAFELLDLPANAAEDVVVLDNLYRIRGDWEKQQNLIGEKASSLRISAENEAEAGRNIDSIRILDLKTLAYDELNADARRMILKDILLNGYAELVMVQVQIVYEGMPMGTQVTDGEYMRFYLLGKASSDETWKLCEFYWSLPGISELAMPTVAPIPTETESR